MLSQIDRELIELLGKRIALLREAKLQDTVEPTQLLAQCGVPEYVWKNLTLACAAASTIAAPATPIRARRIAIVGGRGKMGRFFAEQLSTSGYQVSILDRDDWEHAPELLGKAELVLVCVPIEHTLKAIEKAAPYLAPSCVLADLTSIKSTVVPAMLECHTEPVVSLHPMFGPGARSLLSQNVIVCPGRQREAYQWFLDFIESRGGKLTFSTPQEHDRMMTFVQGIRHFITFSLGVFLAEEGIDTERSLEFASPLYRLQLDMVSRLFAQDASLSMHLMLSAQERRQAISKLAATYGRLALLVAQNDLTALEREFEATRCFLQQAAERALEESDCAIASLSVFLAADRNEVPRDSNNKNLAA
jgi:prephenate dehydrogenase/chorismate mutase/prephenate dehydrogenase